MGKILTALFLCLTILCGFVETASGAAVGFGPKTASGSPEQNPDIYTYELGSLGQEPCWFDEAIHYDPATGVLYYVRQNPWSSFDPTGLAGYPIAFPQGGYDSNIRAMQNNPAYQQKYEETARWGAAAFLAIPAAPVLAKMGASGIAKEVGGVVFDETLGISIPSVKDLRKLGAGLVDSAKRIFKQKGVKPFQTGPKGKLHDLEESWDGLEIHEAPSQGAIRQKIIEKLTSELGQKPANYQIKEVYDQLRMKLPGIALPEKLHELTRTFKQTVKQAKDDALDLDKAAELDAADLVKRGKEVGVNLEKKATQMLKDWKDSDVRKDLIDN